MSARESLPTRETFVVRLTSEFALALVLALPSPLKHPNRDAPRQATWLLDKAWMEVTMGAGCLRRGVGAAVADGEIAQICVA